MTATRPVPIVALDVATFADAQALVARLGPAADFYKVGLQLYTAEGARIVEWLHGEGKRVFLDLKFHDIPNTVRGAAGSVRRLAPALLTVHASGGEAMVRAAVEGAGEKTGVLAVTVLTSMDMSTTGAVFGRDVTSMRSEVLRLAAIARAAGAHGLVCAGSECAAVREAFGNALAPLVPGIRLTGGDAGDQARTVTPAEAAAAGAAYVVLGRAVTQAADPTKALQEATEQLR